MEEIKNLISKEISLLIVENDATCCFFLEEILASSRTHKFKVHSCRTMEDALERLSKEKYDAMLLDMNLPDSRGIETLNAVAKQDPHIAVIVVTGAYDEKMGLEAVTKGAQDYLIKGEYDNKMLLRSVVYATERKKLERDRQETVEKLQRVLEETVGALALSLERRDPYTAGHQQRVAKIACAIADEMGINGFKTNGIRMAGLLHDIGKIHIPSIILTKPGKLSAAERSLIKTHPQVGYEILRNIEFPFPVAKAVLQHHEKVDGSGYPNGVEGKDIMQGSKILCVADVVDAMSSHRPYRSALGIETALKELEDNIGIFFDKDVVESCTHIFRSNKFTLDFTE